MEMEDIGLHYHFFNFLLFFSYLSYLADPINSIWLSFLSLIYPILFFINIILFFIWFFKKKLFFLTTLLFLICGMYHHSRFIQLNPKISHDISFQSKLKVMSFNVRLFDLYNWSHNEETKSKIISFIKNENPDILCFQEYYYDSNNDFVTRDINFKRTWYRILPRKFYQ